MLEIIGRIGIFLFSLYVPFRIDTLTLANVGISCYFLHNFLNAMSASNFSNFVFFYSKSLTTLIKSCSCFFLICLKIFFRAYNFMIKNITRSLIIFKKPRKIQTISSITIYSSTCSSGHHQSV